ncbi:F-box protein At5g51380-like isoform X2 [Salvia hispanica]|uniref:F-box protein At5g51380-like isoform X2 n=1 Tax=Salvia hispanica TaxID=49212 RepID=UPI002009881D|nr:F-box protein At5g51380-like isoform X2 [Salvia hispanica]
MSSLPDHNAVFDPNNPGRKRHFSWPEQLSGERFDQNDVLKHVILKLHLRSISHSGSTTPQSESEPDSESLNSSPLSAAPDCSRALSDELLLNVLSRITDRKQHLSNSLVCKAWCVISGRLIQSIKVLDWEFLESGRSIRSLSLEGCSLLTTEGLESVVLSWTEIDRLKVISCNNVKDSEITPELATLFSDLKELKWRPDSRSLLSASLTGTGIREKGGKSLSSK